MRSMLLAAAAASLFLTACPEGGGGEACPQAFAGCQSLTDATAAGADRTIRFGVEQGNNYAPKCLEVKKGQTITFEGDFVLHPLSAACGTLEETLASTVETGTNSTITFDQAGDFGYFCTKHGTPAGTGMAGFIRVTN